MRIANFFKAAVLALPLLLAACHSQKNVVQPTTATGRPGQAELLQKVEQLSHNKVSTVSAKLKFSATMDGKEVSLGGTLRMKRNDVIRLQLVAFGLLEAARMEFTPDYALIVDRINKQYLKAPYKDIEFLRNSGINFNMLQALFCAELFQPGKTQLSSDDLRAFVTSPIGSTETVVSYDTTTTRSSDTNMNYSWLVDELTGAIRRADVVHNDVKHGNTQLSWDYREMKSLDAARFPTDVLVTLLTPKKELKVGVKLSSLSTDADWEERTTVSSKYRQVSFDELLGRLMSL